MNNNDMIIDIDNFDFSQIDDVKEEVVEVKTTHDLWSDDADEDSYDLDNEEEVEEEDGEGDEPSFTDLNSFAKSFDDIPDDIEFTVGGQAFTKADIAETISRKTEMDNSYRELETYVSNLNASEQVIQEKLNLSMSETETKLRYYNNILARPENLSPQDLRQAYINKQELEKRHASLEQNVAEVRAANAARKDAVNIQRVKSTNIAMRGVEGWKGVETIRDLAGFAQTQGMSPDLVMEGMSPGLMKMLMNAKKYEETLGANKKRVQNAVKKGGNSPRSVSSKPTTKKASTSDRARAAKLYEQGKLSHSQMFDFLVD